MGKKLVHKEALRMHVPQMQCLNPGAMHCPSLPAFKSINHLQGSREWAGFRPLLALHAPLEQMISTPEGNLSVVAGMFVSSECTAPVCMSFSSY